MTAWLRIPAVMALAGGMAIIAGVRVNWTPSLPVGLWLLHDIDAVPGRGTVVEACLPPDAAAFARARRYLGPGNCPGDAMPVLKPVAAVPGDMVEIAADAVRINGAVVVPPGQDRDSLDRPMPVLAPGPYRVRPGEVWLLSTYEPRSFDSRYFGAVPAALLRATATPLLVW